MIGCFVRQTWLSATGNVLSSALRVKSKKIPDETLGIVASAHLASDIGLGEPETALQVVLVTLLDDPQRLRRNHCC